MIKILKKCKYKLLSFSLVLVSLLSLFIGSISTYAWSINGDGNLQSDNLYNKNNNIATNKLISHENGNELYNFEGYYVSDYISIEPLTYYSCNNWNSYYSWWYDSNKNPVSVLPANVNTTLSPNNAYYLRLSSNDIEDLMLNSGSTLKVYEPYGAVYVDPNHYDFNQFLIGDNYFSSGRATIVQTNNNTYWDRQLYPTNSTANFSIKESSIGKYINGKTLNLASLSSDLLSGIRNESGYTDGRFTHISLKPALAIEGTATYPPVQLKYIDLLIYCPQSYNFVASVYLGNLTELGTGDGNHRIEYSRQGDYIHITPNQDYLNEFVWDIDIQLPYISNSYVYPSSIECKTDNLGILDRYELGKESGIRIGDQQGYERGKQDGYKEGDSAGYQRGLNEGASQNLESNGMKTLFNSILSYPVNMIRSIFDFEFMGINVSSLIMFIISIGIVAFVIKRFL